MAITVTIGVINNTIRVKIRPENELNFDIDAAADYLCSHELIYRDLVPFQVSVDRLI